MHRPVAVTVLAILNLVIAAWSLIGAAVTYALIYLINEVNPLGDAMRASPIYANWIKATIPLGLASAVALFPSGIGLLRLKEWARKLSLGFAVFDILYTLVALAMIAIYQVRPLLDEAAGARGAEAAGAYGGAISSLLGGVAGLAYPIVLLVFLTRPNIVAAFRTPGSSMGIPRR
jgi:hypothetical protein